MFVQPAFRLGLDFTGGSALTIDFQNKVSQVSLRQSLVKLDHGESVIQELGSGAFLIRMRQLEDAVGQELSEKEKIQNTLQEEFGPIRSANLSTISPVVASETVRNAIIAVIVAAFGVLVYVTWAFRRMNNPFRLGISAIITLLHDVTLIVGLFSILGKALNFEINAMFVTGVLAVVGYSVNDTIVVFDRIRENAIRNATESLENLVNVSLTETVTRSLNTSLTTIFVILTLLFIGGPTIRGFLVVLLAGFIVGTYSSIFIAPQLLIVWDKHEWLSVFRSRKNNSSTSTSGQAES